MQYSFFLGLYQIRFYFEFNLPKQISERLFEPIITSFYQISKAIASKLPLEIRNKEQFSKSFYQIILQTVKFSSGICSSISSLANYVLISFQLFLNAVKSNELINQFGLKLCLRILLQI
eukprot:TRINITY_DN14150_c0_g1_i1.p4 TRINITY_DN14150_c0_g1~~TRINITY_DN14150_c0_g1_i1.p4  ORF type:complete len:119 (+),score=2.45 TRINITY_DN14150_c0_g1_i1:677-1033(+)